MFEVKNSFLWEATDDRVSCHHLRTKLGALLQQALCAEVLIVVITLILCSGSSVPQLSLASFDKLAH